MALFPTTWCRRYLLSNSYKSSCSLFLETLPTLTTFRQFGGARLSPPFRRAERVLLEQRQQQKVSAPPLAGCASQPFAMSCSSQMSYALSVRDRVLQFWFGSDPSVVRVQLWFQSKHLDQQIQEMFEEALLACQRGELKSLESSTEGTLACILLLDQVVGLSWILGFRLICSYTAHLPLFLSFSLFLSLSRCFPISLSRALLLYAGCVCVCVCVCTYMCWYV